MEEGSEGGAATLPGEAEGPSIPGTSPSDQHHPNDHYQRQQEAGLPEVPLDQVVPPLRDPVGELHHPHQQEQGIGGRQPSAAATAGDDGDDDGGDLNPTIWLLRWTTQHPLTREAVAVGQRQEEDVAAAAAAAGAAGVGAGGFAGDGSSGSRSADPRVEYWSGLARVSPALAPSPAAGTAGTDDGDDNGADERTQAAAGGSGWQQQGWRMRAPTGDDDVIDDLEAADEREAAFDEAVDDWAGLTADLGGLREELAEPSFYYMGPGSTFGRLGAGGGGTARTAAAAGDGGGVWERQREQQQQEKQEEEAEEEGMVSEGMPWWEVEVQQEEEDSDEDVTVESFPLSETELQDTTAQQLLEEGKDLQGIPWVTLTTTRQHSRENRLMHYKNYTNCFNPDDCAKIRAELSAAYPQPRPGGRYYDFHRNWRQVQSTIVHFQLRNLLWASSPHDVFLVHDNQINHWHCAVRQMSTVMDLRGQPLGPRIPGIGRVQVSTMCVAGDLIVAGGFTGELVVSRLGQQGGPVYSGRVTQSENGITNGIEIANSGYLGHGLLTSNNDCFVRWYDVNTCQAAARLGFDWAVNYCSLRPEGGAPVGGPLAAVVGDDPVTALMDIRSGLRAGSLAGHKDYSFAAAWHPNGWLLATGNQDTTTMLWDIRSPAKPCAVLAASMGAVRSLRFSPDGRLLAAAEAADFVHIYDVEGGLREMQEIDVFGEISGIGFSPGGEMFFVGVSDLIYNSLVQYQVRRQGGVGWGDEGREDMERKAAAVAARMEEEQQQLQ